MKTMQNGILPLIIIFVTIYLSGCTKKNQFSLNQEKTLNSLTKINDYPFYTLKYCGDYGFRELLNTGQWPSFFRYEPADNSYRCTCVAAMGSDTCKRFGRNFDNKTRSALLLFTDPPDGYASVSMIWMKEMGYTETNTPDITGKNFNLLSAPYFCQDGMNEKGVAIGIMSVNSVFPPYDPAKIGLYSSQIVRLTLDYASTLDEAITLMNGYNVSFEYGSPVHFLIADKSGASAIIEFIDNDIKVIRNTEKWQVCTNFIIYGTDAPENVSCWRYNTAYSALKECNGNVSADKTMDIMKLVSQGGTYKTMWSIVYDFNTLKTAVVTDRDYSKKYIFSLDNHQSYIIKESDY